MEIDSFLRIKEFEQLLPLILKTYYPYYGLKIQVGLAEEKPNPLFLPSDSASVS